MYLSFKIGVFFKIVQELHKKRKIHEGYTYLSEVWERRHWMKKDLEYQIKELLLPSQKIYLNSSAGIYRSLHWQSPLSL